MARILIIRFSALGDVAMTVPVVHSLAAEYPQHEIIVLSRTALQPLFLKLPENVSFYGADLSGKHKGLRGLNSLYAELKGYILIMWPIFMIYFARNTYDGVFGWMACL